MSKEEQPAPRGEAAYAAAKKDIAKRNEAAYARGRKEREAKDAAERKKRAAAERHELDNLPRPGASA